MTYHYTDITKTKNAAYPSAANTANQRRRAGEYLQDNRGSPHMQFKIRDTVSNLPEQIHGQNYEPYPVAAEVVQRVQWFPAASRAPLGEIRDYEAGANGQRPRIDPLKLRDFKKVQDILHNEDSVNRHMDTLNRETAEMMRRNAGLSSRDAMLAVLRRAEARQGYDPDEGIIDSSERGPEGARKLSGFGKAGKAFQDFGVSATQHGPDTHRIQQYILYRENEERRGQEMEGEQGPFEHAKGALGVYKDMANYRYGIHTKDYKLNQHDPGRAGRDKIYAWELLLDRVNGKVGVDVLDHRTGEPLQPDAGYPIHLMERMRKGDYGEAIKQAAHQGQAASDKHDREENRKKLARQGGYAALGGLGIGALASAGLGLTGWPLAAAMGLGALGGYLFGGHKRK